MVETGKLFSELEGKNLAFMYCLIITNPVGNLDCLRPCCHTGPCKSHINLGLLAQCTGTGFAKLFLLAASQIIHTQKTHTYPSSGTSPQSVFFPASTDRATHWDIIFICM
jgi:hypothetical protein